MTYFHMRMHTIIGATPFHDPVRDGMGWVQSAMAAKRKRNRGKQSHDLEEVNNQTLKQTLK